MNSVLESMPIVVGVAAAEDSAFPKRLQHIQMHRAATGQPQGNIITLYRVLSSTLLNKYAFLYIKQLILYHI